MHRLKHSLPLVLGLICLCGCQTNKPENQWINTSTRARESQTTSNPVGEAAPITPTAQIAPSTENLTEQANSEPDIERTAQEILHQIDHGSEHVVVGTLTWLSADRTQGNLRLKGPLELNHLYLATRDDHQRVTAIFRANGSRRGPSQNLILVEGFPSVMSEVIVPSRAVRNDIENAHGPAKPETNTGNADTDTP